MKKFVLALASFSFLLISCKSDYQCVCISNGTEVGSQDYENVTRSQAVSKCDAYQTIVRLSHPGAVCASPY